MQKEISKTKPRIRSVDAGRGIAMWCIVTAHVLRKGTLADTLMCLGVAAFLVLTGYVENYDAPVRKAVKKRIKRLYLPYLAVGLVSIVLYRILGELASGSLSTIEGEAEYRILPNLGYLLAANSKIHHSMKWNETLWFLPCFLVSLLLAAIPEKIAGHALRKTESTDEREEDRRREKASRTRGAARLFFSVLYYAAGTLLVSRNLRLPFQAETALHLAPFLLLGHAMGDERRRRSSQKPEGNPMEAAGFLFSVTGLAAALPVMAYTGSPSIRTDEYPHGALSYVLALFVSFLFVTVLAEGEALLLNREENRTSKKQSESGEAAEEKEEGDRRCGARKPSVPERIGRRSLGIMLWNKFPVVFLQLVLGKLGMTGLFLEKSTPAAFFISALLGLVCIGLCLIFTGIPSWFRRMRKKQNAGKA